MDRIFAGMWIGVCRLDQIANRGAFLRRDVANADVPVAAKEAAQPKLKLATAESRQAAPATAA